MAIDGVGRPTKGQAAEQKLMRSWLATITAYDKTFAEWEKRADRVNTIYRAAGDVARGGTEQSKFNVFWSNVQTLIPATFSRLPQPDVSRRFKDNDPVGRVASEILERALDFEIQHYPDYRATMKQSVQERFVGGRGTSWVRYEPHIRAANQQLPTDGAQVSEDIDTPGEELDYECAPTDYVHYRDFGHSVARTWEEVTRVWRKVYLDREACIERFGEEVGEKIPLDSSPMEKDKPNAPAETDSEYCRALVYEGWDKTTKKAYWFCKGMKGEFLDIKSDPLSLEGFFPCPRPLYATLTNDSLIPVPDYKLYESQCEALNALTRKIDGLIIALQVKGVYDASIPELKRIFTEATNTDLIPVANWAAFAEKNGLTGCVELIDLKNIYEALKNAYLAAHEQKQQIYDITGLADIVRGASNANETATAQKIKGQYASLRLKANQEEVAQYATECLRMKAQIICGKFDPETIRKISAVDQLTPEDQALVPQAMELLLGPRANNPELEGQHNANPLRSFRIDIAADTLVQMDEDAEKESRVEFLQATGAFMKEALPIIQQAPQAAPLIISMLKFGVTGFKVGKQIEGTIDEALDQLQAAAKQPRQQPPDPEMEKVKAQQQMDAARLQADQQADQARLQMEMAMERMRSQAQQESDRQKATFEFQLDGMRMQQEQAFARFEAMLKAKTAIEVAEISAQSTLDTAQISAADKGTEQ